MTSIHLGDAHPRSARPWEREASFERERRETFRAMLRESITANAKRETTRRAALEQNVTRARAAADAAQLAQARAAALRRSAEEHAREQLFAEFRRELEIIDKAKAVGLSGDQALALARRHATDEEIIAATREAHVLAEIERMFGGRP